ncbi:hypothetical protein [Elizabethkingia anophelis]|nr:hypothetical protein [Elizabethkingia anophelis]
MEAKEKAEELSKRIKESFRPKKSPSMLEIWGKIKQELEKMK